MELNTNHTLQSAAIYVAILDNRIAVNLPTDVADAVIPAGLPSSSLVAFLEALSSTDADALTSVPGVTPSIIAIGLNAVKTAYSESFRTVFLASIAFGGLAVVAALFSVNVDKELNNAVAAKLAGTGASEEALDNVNDVEKAHE